MYAIIAHIKDALLVLEVMQQASKSTTTARKSSDSVIFLCPLEAESLPAESRK
jgi:hypothetical protein